MKTNFTTTSLQAASTVLSSNTEAIDTLKKEHAGIDLFEAAQLFLIDKYKLSQSEAFEVVSNLRAGIEEYQAARTSIEANYESTVREAIKNSLNSLSKEEQTRYLASMLSALQLASKSECTQTAIDEAVSANSNEPQEVLIEKIISTLNTLPLEAVATAAKALTPEAIKSVAEAINKNTADYRFMAAIQLYAAQREGLLKLQDEQSPLPPKVLGALASASVDAMLATADLQDEKITLAKWQVIMKYILGALFVVTCSFFAVMVITSIALSVMLAIWSALGTGAIALFISFVGVLPILTFGMDCSVAGITKVAEWLSPIYDKVVQTITNWANAIFASIKSWLNNAVQTIKEKHSEAQTTATATSTNTLTNNDLALA